MRQFLFPDKNPVSQLGFTIVVSLGIFLIFYLLAAFTGPFIFGNEIVELAQKGNINNPVLLGYLRYVQIIFSIGLFIIPPIFLAFVFSGKPLAYLSINTFPNIKEFALIFFIMISAIPLINYLTYFNSQIRFPAFLSDLENYFMKAEKSATEQTNAFLVMPSLSDLWFNIFMMGLLPAVGEELMFRGLLQRIFSNLTRNVHWGIIISSFLFSAVHLQFYGLFPRWLLGLFFGYMVLYSGSIWLPITAHLLNNTMIIVSQYFTIPGSNANNPVDFGTAPGMVTYAILSLLLVIVGFVFLAKKKNTNYFIFND